MSILRRLNILLMFRNYFIWILFGPMQDEILEKRYISLTMIMSTPNLSLFMRSLLLSFFLKLFANVCNVKREKKLAGSFTFKVNMAKNLRILTSTFSELLNGLLMSFLLPFLSSKLGLSKGKTIPFKKWRKSCFMPYNFLLAFVR